MLTLSVKKRQNTNNPKIGYIKPLLIIENEQLIISNRTLIPKDNEVVCFTDYDNLINNKFQNNELFIIEIQRLEEDRIGSCEYSAIFPPKKNMGFTTVFEISGSIDPNRLFEISSAIKPVNGSFLIFTEEKGKEIAGPFEISQQNFNSITNEWDTQFKIPTPVFSSKNNLQDYKIYKVDFDIVGKENIIKVDVFSTIQGNFYIANNLLNYLQTIQANMETYHDDRVLFKLLTDAQDNDNKLSRSLVRDLIKQTNALKQLEEIPKDRIFKYLTDNSEAAESLRTKLPENLKAYEKTIEGDEDKNDTSSEEKKKIDQLMQDLQDERNRNIDLESKNTNIEKELKTFKENDDLTNLNNEIIDLKKQVNVEKSLSNLNVEEETLTKNIEKYKKEITSLEESKQDINGQLEGSMSAFKTRAMEILPLFGVLSSSSISESLKPISYSNINFVSNTDNLIEVIVSRIEEQGYKQDFDFLISTVSAYFSARLIGFFGPPGTGKTSLAKLISNSISPNPNSSAFVSVGKGWSSAADFIGYLNPFSEKFEYKNSFFSQFETNDYDNKNYPVRTIVLDESSVSSPDTYLADFITLTSGVDETNFGDKIQLSKKILYIPDSLKVLMTFNNDESTEAISDKIVDRMPIIHCKEIENAEFTRINEKQYDPFNENQLNDFIAIYAQNAISKKETKYTQLIEEELLYWQQTIDNFTISPRKRKQINIFLQLIDNNTDLSGEKIRDFICNTYLTPKIKGSGENYLESLQELISRKDFPIFTKNNIEKIISNGSRFGHFSYL